MPGEPTDNPLMRAAVALRRIGDNCLSLQRHDAAASLAGLSSEDIARRQLLDRVSQEIAALAAFYESYALTRDVDAALSKVDLHSVRERLASCDSQGDAIAGDAELF